MRKKHSTPGSQTDWDKLRGLRDEDIDYSDIPPLDETFFQEATLRLPRPKRHLSLRLDEDIYLFLKIEGRGYQTRINAVLRQYMEARQRAAGR